ncbi:MAG TPA: hypothetical protein VJA47_02215 [archaeon]|nr:hypothetical protein [archaeon]
MVLRDYQPLDNPLIPERRITYDAGGWVKIMLVLDLGNCVGGQYYQVHGDIVEWKWNGRTRVDTVRPTETLRRERMLKGLKENGIDGYISFV